MREKAAVSKDQQEVWRANQEARDQVLETLATEAPASAPAAREQLGRSSSYAQMENTPEITACEAITVAAVARMIMMGRAHSGASK